MGDEKSGSGEERHSPILYDLFNKCITEGVPDFLEKKIINYLIMKGHICDKMYEDIIGTRYQHREKNDYSLCEDCWNREPDDEKRYYDIIPYEESYYIEKNITFDQDTPESIIFPYTIPWYLYKLNTLISLIHHYKLQLYKNVL